MNGREKILLDRVVFGLLGVVLVTIFALLYRVFAVDASFSAGVGAAEAVAADAGAGSSQSIEEPADTFELVSLTFGGTCTPASMLGSDSFGTFNSFYNEKGASYFFSELQSTFQKDDLTILGCNAVLTDRKELTMAEKTESEWFRGTASAAGVFSKADVEILSLACRRTRDYGTEGYGDTKAALEAEGLLWGDSGKPFYTATACGIDMAIGFFTYTEENLLSTVSWIEDVKTEYDLVAVYITDTEDTYLVSEEKQRAYRSLVDAGARLVVGVSGSKLQTAEEYGGGFIAYSLGTLLDGASKYPEKYAGLLNVWVKVNDGKITGLDCRLMPCVTYNEEHQWQPFLLDKGEEYDAVMAFLDGETTSPYA